MGISQKVMDFLWKLNPKGLTHFFWRNPLFFPHKILISSGPINRNPKTLYRIKCDVGASKNAVRHFLRRDYLHILFYITFLGFVSLIHQIRIFAKIIPISKAAIPPNTSAITCCFINNVDANIPSDIRIVATR